MNLYGSTYVFSNTGYGFGYNIIISGVLEAGAFLLLYFILHTTRRRVGIAVAYMGCFGLGMLLFMDGVEGSLLVVSGVLGVMRFGAVIGVLFVTAMMIEYFDVRIQSSSFGIIQSLNMIGIFCVPFVVNICEEHEISAIGVLAIFFFPVVLPLYFLR